MASKYTRHKKCVIQKYDSYTNLYQFLFRINLELIDWRAIFEQMHK